MGPVRIRHSSHVFGWQSSHFVDLAGWQAKMASIEIWIPWRNAHKPHLYPRSPFLAPTETLYGSHDTFSARCSPRHARSGVLVGADAHRRSMSSLWSRLTSLGFSPLRRLKFEESLCTNGENLRAKVRGRRHSRVKVFLVFVWQFQEWSLLKTSVVNLPPHHTRLSEYTLVPSIDSQPSTGTYSTPLQTLGACAAVVATTGSFSCAEKVTR